MTFGQIAIIVGVLFILVVLEVALVLWTFGAKK